MINISEVKKKINILTTEGRKYLFIIDFDGNGEVFTPEEAEKAGIFFSFTPPPAQLPYPVAVRTTLKAFEPLYIPYSQYESAFNKAQHYLKKGDTYLLNLTFATEVKTGYSLNEIYELSTARYKLLYKDQFVIFSPERFIRIADGTIETNPMKGTIDASEPGAEEKLLSNEKEFYEHNTIVDLLRNDLNMVAMDVSVKKFRYVEKIRTHKGELLQVSSLISGKLRPNYKETMGDIISTLLPAGSVTGAPKERTVKIIREVENYNRGFYTGVFGYYDGQSLDVAVAIRFIEKIGNKFYYKSGGGITSLSNAIDEYNEMLSKIYIPIL